MYGIKTIFWSPETLLFYIGVIICSYLFSNNIRTYIKKRDTHGKRNIWLIITFLILLIVMGTRTVGRDLNRGYYYNFETATSVSSYGDQSVEKGFIILNVIIKTLFNNYSVFVFVVSSIILYCVYYVINKYSDKIKISNAVLIYTSIFFFSSFSPLRQTLAASICLLAYDSLIEKKQIKALVFILLASLIHTSSLIMLIPFFIAMFKAMNKKMIVLSAISAFVVIFLLRNSFSSMFVGRYSGYSVSNNIEFGFRWIVYYLPIVILLYSTFKKNKSKDTDRINITIVALGFLFEILEYVISIFGRFDVLTLPFIIIIPYYMAMEKSKTIKTIEQIVLYAYCALRFWVFISDNYSSQDLMPYTSILFGN